jgi:hypothetical protein
MGNRYTRNGEKIGEWERNAKTRGEIKRIEYRCEFDGKKKKIIFRFDKKKGNGKESKKRICVMNLHIFVALLCEKRKKRKHRIGNNGENFIVA